MDQIIHQALDSLSQASTVDQIKILQAHYLGRKGLITQFLRSISTMPQDMRPAAGKKVNEAKQVFEEKLKERTAYLEYLASKNDAGIDVTLPGRFSPYGTLHPITQITNEICRIFRSIGFQIVEGPEIETDYYNFEALNIPKDHPARDMQDTFYVSDSILLRTHTSPMQIRTMKKISPPLRIIAPGKVYRCDSDITHTPMFHQVEGLMVDKYISFADLKGILTLFVHEMFDPSTSLRFRPSFFPFTEPSAEVDIRCVMCKGAGCRVCSQTGWLEVLGAGMVHPNVFRNVNYNTDTYSGFAFGMGVERITMLKYGIDDIRKFFENDLRFLGQF
ncbi:MAG: phenylalanine--tRNA ligase subunit alpha [Desulfobacterales bacterium]|nr:phenylalanine--tRNA ligase subunit alpha [Desulfobacterales bacterium]